MAEETEDQEKTEEATPRRLEKAREDGQVARSRELTTVMLLFDRRQGFDSTVMLTHAAVSYTHLTLPTIYSV